MAQWREEIFLVGRNSNVSVAEDYPVYFQLDTTKYAATTVSYYFEVLSSGAASNTGTSVLRRFGTTTDDASSANGTATGLTLKRVAFTPPAGQTVYFLRNNADGTHTQKTVFARIIIILSGTITSIQHQFTVGDSGSPLTAMATSGATDVVIPAPRYFYYDSTKWDGIGNCYFEAVFSPSATARTGNIRLQVSDGTGDGFQNFTNVISVTLTGTTTNTRVRSASFTLTSGRNYRAAFSLSGGAGTVRLITTKLIIEQSNPTKEQAQYVTNNNGASLGGNDAHTWDDTEWSGTNNTYEFAVDSASSSTASVDLRDAGNAVLATVANPNNQSRVSVTMPTAQTLNVNATVNTNSDVYGTSIIAYVVNQSIAPSFVPRMSLMGVG